MSVLSEAKELKEIIIKHRRFLHKNAETHLSLPLSSSYVFESLKAMGYSPQRIGESGVVAVAGGKKPGKTFLLRADMDALPIVEENDLPFKSETGAMHACGHDLHSSMLLGAAQILKNHEDDIRGQVKLMFQPGEETMSGAMMMIEGGVLEAPTVDAAMMLHVLSGTSFPTGTAIISRPGMCSCTNDRFTIAVRGKGCHGAMPHRGVDPLNVLAHIHIALQAVNARETAPSDTVVLTVGQMHGGNTDNIIPDTAYMAGTIRTIDESLREFIKKRVQEIAAGIGAAFKAEVSVSFDKACPCSLVSDGVNSQVSSYITDILGKEHIHVNAEWMDINSTSEDFAFISKSVPSTVIFLSAGSKCEGYVHPLHHPSVAFNEEALPIGAAIYADSAMRWLDDN